jgi:hypothetical protein
VNSHSDYRNSAHVSLCSLKPLALVAKPQRGSPMRPALSRRFALACSGLISPEQQMLKRDGQRGLRGDLAQVNPQANNALRDLWPHSHQDHLCAKQHRCLCCLYQ